MSVIGNIQLSLDLGKYTGGVFIDLRKGFDTVDYKKNRAFPMVSGEYQIDRLGHIFKREHILFQLETINSLLEMFWLVFHKVQS